MYRDQQFQVDDPEVIRAFIDANPFATLVAVDAAGRVAATHLPVLIEQFGTPTIFRCHLMRDTDHWHAVTQAQEVFVSFLGPDAPILASWQSTMRFGGTWNYQVVHARAQPVPRDADTLVRHLKTLKDRFEVSPGHRFEHLPEGYVAALTPMIQCFDLVVTELQCLFKLSQNRSDTEFKQTVAALTAQGGKSQLLADAMLAWQATRGAERR
ncbi:FMN-binding negative transcriptional regulator [Ahniella affigens]|nr:FMN-binding negative transcriptional regulator [Ahniella affigens]